MKRAERIQLGSLALNLISHGAEDNPPLLLLHGFPDFHYGWRQQAAFLEDRGYRLLIPDQRGVNLTDKPPQISDYALDLLGQDMLNLLDYLKIQRLPIIGHDWGAAIAWWLAHHHPERVEKLVIMNTPHPQILQHFIRHHRPQTFKSWYMLFFQIPWLPEWILSWGKYVHFSQTLKEGARRGSFSEEDLKQYRQAWSQPGSMTAMLNWYRAAWRFPSHFPETPVQAPTLMFWGLKDPHLLSDMIEPSLALCHQARCVRFKYAGHWVHLDEFEAVNDHLLAFLQQNQESL